VVLVGRVRRVASLDEIHMNVQCAIVLYTLKKQILQDDQQ